MRQTIFSVVVADLENEMLLLMNVHNGEIQEKYDKVDKVDIKFVRLIIFY